MSWQRNRDQWNREYYVNHRTKATQWEAPPFVEFDENGYEITGSVTKDVPPSDDLLPSYEAATNGAAPPPVAPPAYSQFSSNPSGYAGAPLTSNLSVVNTSYQSNGSYSQPHPPGAGFSAPMNPMYAAPANTPTYAAPIQTSVSTLQHIPPVRATNQAVLNNTPVNTSTGFFGTIARSVQNLITGTPVQQRAVYPNYVQGSAITMIECPSRDPISRSIPSTSKIQRACSTPCALPCATVYTFIMALFLGLMIFGIVAFVEDSMMIGLMIPFIVLFIYASISYIVIMVCCSFCSASSGRMCGGCLSPLYTNMHIMMENEYSTISNCYDQINRMDQARPSLFIRVEGYSTKSQYDTAVSMHNSALQNNNRRNVNNNFILYGFTHHLPVGIASAENVSAPSQALDQWYNDASTLTILDFRYDYMLSPADEQWLTGVLANMKRSYQGQEGCGFIQASVVYTLDGVTPTAPMNPAFAFTPYDTENCYNMYQRPGVNTGLFDWKYACVNHETGNAKAVQYIGQTEKPSYCCHILFFNQLIVFLSLMTITYVPYVAFWRCCIVREEKYIHKKRLYLTQSLVPAVDISGSIV